MRPAIEAGLRTFTEAAKGIYETASNVRTNAGDGEKMDRSSDMQSVARPVSLWPEAQAWLSSSVLSWPSALFYAPDSSFFQCSWARDIRIFYHGNKNSHTTKPPGHFSRTPVKSIATGKQPVGAAGV
jgi:hypothetical protein